MVGLGRSDFRLGFGLTVGLNFDLGLDFDLDLDLDLGLDLGLESDLLFSSLAGFFIFQPQLANFSSQVCILNRYGLWRVRSREVEGGEGEGGGESGGRETVVPASRPVNEIHYISRFPSPVMGMFDMYIYH